MKKNKIFVALALLAGLAGCTQPTPKSGPWGYDFALGSFRDERDDPEAQLTSQNYFEVDKFMESFKKHTQRDVFAHRNAKLDVTLSRYEATKSDMSYALTMDMTLRGRDEYGRVLADKPLRCVVVDHVDTNLVGASVQQAVDQRTLCAVTKDCREQTMWQRVFDACVRELTIQFGQALYAGV